MSNEIEYGAARGVAERGELVRAYRKHQKHTLRKHSFSLAFRGCWALKTQRRSNFDQI